MLAGHSQGGLIAVNLGSLSAQEIGIDVRAILAMGAPARRTRIRPDVVMVDIAHDQDVVPSTDGTPARAPDHRIMVGRKLIQPRLRALYYAHSSSTYTETVGHLERRSAITQWDRVGQAVRSLQAMLPQGDEPTRVRIYDVWQELDDPNSGVWSRVKGIHARQLTSNAQEADDNHDGVTHGSE